MSVLCGDNRHLLYLCIVQIYIRTVAHTYTITAILYCFRFSRRPRLRVVQSASSAAVYWPADECVRRHRMCTYNDSLLLQSSKPYTFFSRLSIPVVKGEVGRG